MNVEIFLEKITKFLVKIFGSRNERIIESLKPIVEKINDLEPSFKKLSDQQLRAKTQEFKQRLRNGETLDDLLPEAFATVREASKRTLGMRHFDVQLMGGIVLHQGKIAEMVTGEGKTLVATLPAYLNALTGDGVHIVTVNDYLAKRDRDWMGPIYEFLGLSVGVIQADMDNEQRKKEYMCDITYGTNNEFGFDYLRDNMKIRLEDQVQRSRNYAIIDEVDSVLIDEARTPLIISGPAEESTQRYYQIDRIVRKLKKDIDYKVNEKDHTVTLTEEGIKHAEKLLGIDNFYTGKYIDIPHYIENALKAHNLFKRDRDYVVDHGEVIIVDEFTGRLMPGRRWSDGLHQAIEAKEGLKIKEENQTLATITFQNFFKLYKKIAGMTGTAMTEALEFEKIYGLEVVSIPTNKPLIRIDYPDSVYGTEKEKFNAIVEEIVRIHKTGRPILVGTISIEKSEKLSEMLKRRGIPHEVLNAKHHKREAEIIAKAGQKGHVTIATNMAGRGTDIVLGEGVAELGGLHVIGTERHNARRIDNQLRGRAGRQGDPGSSKFYVSLEDDLMRIFASEWVANIMRKIGLKDGQPIEHPMVTRAIEKAQKKVEEHNFEIRKHLLEYDSVMNEQRTIIYSQRQEILEGKNLKEMVIGMIEDLLKEDIQHYLLEPKEPEIEEFIQRLKRKYEIDISKDWIFENISNQELLFDEIRKKILEKYQEKEKAIGQENMRKIEQFVLLQTIDKKWKDHLYVMDHLKEGIGLRAYGQRDPIIEYKKEGFELFQIMIKNIKEEVTDLVMKINVATGEEMIEDIWVLDSFIHENFQGFEKERKAMEEAMANTNKETHIEPIRRKEARIGRNDPCPCGSGKKYKKCCGKNLV